MPDANGALVPGDDGYYAERALDPLGLGGSGAKNGKRPANFGEYLQNSGANAWNSMNGGYTAANIQAAGPDAQSQGLQNTLIQQLQAQASGNGPSLAQMQLQKGTDQNLAQAMALGASQRGVGAGAMQRGIANQQSSISQGMAGDAAMLRLQEQMQARQQLGDQLNQSANRAADLAKTNAGLALEKEKLNAADAKQRSPMGLIGGLFSAFSDEKLKTEVAPAESKLYDFLDKLGSHEYRYKDSKHGEGRRVSPMAQELESSDVGKAFVFETPEGKAVDYAKGFGEMLASQAALHKRLKALEGA